MMAAISAKNHSGELKPMMHTVPNGSKPSFIKPLAVCQQASQYCLNVHVCHCSLRKAFNAGLSGKRFRVSWKTFKRTTTTTKTGNECLGMYWNC